jgi:hypothetical protein
MKQLKDLSKRFFRLFGSVFSFFIILSIFGIIFIYYQPSQEKHHMKLINIKSKFVVAEYKGETTIIHDRILEKEMRMRGIIIPSILQPEYGGKAVVRLNEKEFQKAFKELYFTQVFNPKNYHWEE